MGVRGRRWRLALSVAPLDRATVIRLASLREHHVVPPPAPTGPRGAPPTDVLGRESVLMSPVPLIPEEPQDTPTRDSPGE